MSILQATVRRWPGAPERSLFAPLRQSDRLCGLTAARVPRQGGSGGRQSAAGPPTPALLRILRDSLQILPPASAVQKESRFSNTGIDFGRYKLVPTMRPALLTPACIPQAPHDRETRSEERRVGNECTSRW